MDWGTPKMPKNVKTLRGFFYRFNYLEACRSRIYFFKSHKFESDFCKSRPEGMGFYDYYNITKQHNGIMIKISNFRENI